MSRRNVGTLITPRGKLYLIDGATPADLQTLTMDAGLGIFWHVQPQRQLATLIQIAELPEGHVALIHTCGRVVIGYITLLPPQPDTPWGRFPDVLEAKEMEVSPQWRRLGIAHKMLHALLADPVLEEKVIIITAPPGCWDPESMGLSLAEYRKVVRRLLEPFGFLIFSPDDPNLPGPPDSLFSARIGSRVRPETRAFFEARWRRYAAATT